MPTPLVSIIVLNYFGEKVLPNTLTSLLQLKTAIPYEVIVVDNNSQDKSPKIIEKYTAAHSNIRSLYLNQNKGFSAANNEGIKISQGKYVVLLNNDCVVDTNWLTALVTTAETDPNIFAVTSKIILYPYFKRIPITSNIHKVKLAKSQLLSFSKGTAISLPISKKDGKYFVEIAFTPQDSFVELTFITRDKKSQTKQVAVSIKDPGVFQKIQNAGSMVFPDGYSRDIGAAVTKNTQDFEPDKGQYDVSKEVLAVCGAACLFRKGILNKIGLLDEDSFMYYEDTEISERAQLYGYKNVYCHAAVVRHLHAFSAKEWSDFFICQVEKGRLLHMLAHYPLRIALTQLAKFIFFALVKLGYGCLHFRHLKRFLVQTKVSLALLIALPKLSWKRLSFTYNHANREKLYQLLASGYYFRN